MRDKDQIFRYTKSEMTMMKGLFADNEDLLFLIRKVMLGFSLNESEQSTLKGVVTEPVNTLLYKVFFPVIDPDSPFGQVADLAIGLGADLKGIGPDEGWPLIRAKELEIQYISEHLKRFTNLDYKPSVTLESLSKIKGPKTSREDIYVNIVARNWLLSIIDGSMVQVKALAGLKSETAEETINRLAKNSNK